MMRMRWLISIPIVYRFQYDQILVVTYCAVSTFRTVGKVRTIMEKIVNVVIKFRIILWEFF